MPFGQNMLCARREECKDLVRIKCRINPHPKVSWQVKQIGRNGAGPMRELRVSNHPGFAGPRELCRQALEFNGSDCKLIDLQPSEQLQTSIGMDRSAHFNFRGPIKLNFSSPGRSWVVSEHCCQIQSAACLKNLLAGCEVPASFCKKFAERISDEQALKVQTLVLYREFRIQIPELIVIS